MIIRCRYVHWYYVAEVMNEKDKKIVSSIFSLLITEIYQFNPVDSLHIIDLYYIYFTTLNE